MTRTVVVVPAFDEERTMAKVTVGARKEVGSVTVCDDGSGDMTVDIAERGQGSPRSSKPTREELFDLYAAGETKVKDIAALFGVDKAIIFKWLKSYKIPTRTSVRFSRVHLPERSRGPFDLTNTGLYDGDGAKATPGRIGFTNSNLDLVDAQIRWFESLGVERRHLKFKIGVADEASHAAFRDEICRRFGVLPDQFWKPGTLRGKQNTVIVTYVNTKFAVELRLFRERIRDGISTPAEAAEYLKGAFAADGSAHAGKHHGCFVSIAFNAKTEQYLLKTYKRCFALLEVTVSVQAQGYDGDVRVFYHDSVVRLFEAGIFDLHPSAKSAVEKYLSNFKSPQTRKGMALEIALEACRFLEKAQEPVRAESLARVLGRKKGTASKLLIKLVKCGRIKLVEKPWKSERIYELAE